MSLVQVFVLVAHVVLLLLMLQRLVLTVLQDNILRMEEFALLVPITLTRQLVRAHVASVLMVTLELVQLHAHPVELELIPLEVLLVLLAPLEHIVVLLQSLVLLAAVVPSQPPVPLPVLNVQMERTQQEEDQPVKTVQLTLFLVTVLVVVLLVVLVLIQVLIMMFVLIVEQELTPLMVFVSIVQMEPSV